MNKLIGLVVGSRETLSLGRVAFWLIMGVAIYFWLARPIEAFPPTLETALGLVLVYIIGGKAINKLNQSSSQGVEDK